MNDILLKEPLPTRAPERPISPSSPFLQTLNEEIQTLAKTDAIEILAHVARHSFFDGVSLAHQNDALSSKFLFRAIDNDMLHRQPEQMLAFADVLYENLRHLDPRNQEAASLLISKIGSSLRKDPLVIPEIQMRPQLELDVGVESPRLNIGIDDPKVDRLKALIDAHYTPALEASIRELELPSNGNSLLLREVSQPERELARAVIEQLYPELRTNRSMRGGLQVSVPSLTIDNPLNNGYGFGTLSRQPGTLGYLPGVQSGLYITELFGIGQQGLPLTPERLLRGACGGGPYYPLPYFEYEEEYRPSSRSRRRESSSKESSERQQSRTTDREYIEMGSKKEELGRAQKRQAQYAEHVDSLRIQFYHRYKERREEIQSEAIISPKEFVGLVCSVRAEEDDARAIQRIVDKVRRSTVLSGCPTLRLARSANLSLGERVSLMRARMNELRAQDLDHALELGEAVFAGDQEDLAELTALVLSDAGFHAGVGHGVVAEDERLCGSNAESFTWVKGKSSEGDLALLIDVNPTAKDINSRYQAVEVS